MTENKKNQLDKLKQQRDALNAKIQAAEARSRGFRTETGYPPQNFDWRVLFRTGPAGLTPMGRVTTDHDPLSHPGQ